MGLTNTAHVEPLIQSLILFLRTKQSLWFYFTVVELHFYASQVSNNLFILSFPSVCLSSAALQALKRKKRYEKQLTQIDGTLSTIEFQREALENANTNTEVLKNMGFAAKAMKKVHENM